MLWLIDKSFSWLTNKNYQITYDNIQNIATGQRDGYTIGCFLDYPYFKEHYKMIAIDLSKEQALDADQKKTKKKQPIHFTRNLGRAEGAIIFSLLKKQKKLFLVFHKEP